MACVTLKKCSVVAMIFLSLLQQSWTRLDASIMRLNAMNSRRQHALAGSDIENPFAGLGIKQLHHSWNRQFAMVDAAIFAHPAIIPVRQWLPTCPHRLFAISFGRHECILPFVLRCML